MQVSNYDKRQVVNLINEARDIAVIPSKTARGNSFCAAAGLFYMIKQKFEDDDASNDKNIRFVYSGKVPDDCVGVMDEADISADLDSRYLLVSIDYSNTPAAKAQYSHSDDTLYLKLGPVPRDFETNRVRSRVTGFDFDLIIVVGAQELEDLGPIYNNLRSEIDNAKIINMDNTNNNRRFGVVNVIDTYAENLSMLIMKEAVNLEMSLNAKAAKALLSGITSQVPSQ